MGFDWSLVAFFAIVIAAAMSGAFFQPGEWYKGLRKPVWTPPNWLFGPVWSVLYIAIAVAGWLIWKAEPSSGAMWMWGAQLVLNAGWSALFFGARRMDMAFGDVLLLWLSIAGFITLASGISTVAAALFVPYLVWVTIAATLNFTVWRMNPQES